jgi:hypothetical protein
MDRIAWTVAALVLAVPGAALAQRTDVSRDFPIYANGGKPDFTVDPQRFVAQMEIVDRLFEAGDCELEEGTVGGMPEGDYMVEVTVNAINLFDEGENRYPNTIKTQVHVPSPRKKVQVDDSPLLQAK